MNTTARRARASGFTMIEMLTVIAIIAILAAIIVPTVRFSQRSAYKRRAVVEMNSIKVAIMQFYSEFHYMPWGDPQAASAIRVGDDVWTTAENQQLHIMRWLTGENPKQKSFLEIPERSRPSADTFVFLDPWKNFYHIGLDRNLDGAVKPNIGSGDYVTEKVLVYSLGDPDDKKAADDKIIKTW